MAAQNVQHIHVKHDKYFLQSLVFYFCLHSMQDMKNYFRQGLFRNAFSCFDDFCFSTIHFFKFFFLIKLKIEVSFFDWTTRKRDSRKTFLNRICFNAVMNAWSNSKFFFYSFFTHAIHIRKHENFYVRLRKYRQRLPVNKWNYIIRSTRCMLFYFCSV